MKTWLWPLTRIQILQLLTHYYSVPFAVQRLYLATCPFSCNDALPAWIWSFHQNVHFLSLLPRSPLFPCVCAPVRRVPPRFTIPPVSHEIMPGGSVNITCVAVGSPMPYVKWMLNSEDLTPEDEMPVGRNVLELNGVRESANYTCVAMSSLGIIESVAQVIVKCKERSFLMSNYGIFPA